MPCASQPSLVLLEPEGPVSLPREATTKRRGADGVWCRLAERDQALWVTYGVGGQARRERLLANDVLRLGRRATPIATRLRSRRYPDAVKWCGFIARDARTRWMLSRLAAAAPSDAPVWLSGESGTGKELAARALHDASPRRSGPFVALNCAALPESLAEAELFGARRGAFTGADRDREGAFARADGGTLFLDEVAELPLSTQAKLLRVLETGEVQALGAHRPKRVSVRVVSATWRDAASEHASGRFRFDLLQRLGVLQVTLAPLRARPDDIGPLLESTLASLDALDLWPEPELLAAIEHAPWPGNVRELINVARRAAVWGVLQVPAHSDASPRSASPHLPRSGPLPGRRKARAMSARSALRASAGNHAAAARTLGISRSTLYRWLGPREGALRGEQATDARSSPVDTP